jgi:CIC family chloride channel protein
VSAVLLAVELLLFELRPRSLIPVALAAAAATAVRIGFAGIAPAFAMPNIVQPSESALAAYVVLGALVGVAAVGVTKIVYAVEDAFDHLPIHWMWWPALGAIAVGVCGFFAPHTLGVGYDNIDRILEGEIAGPALLALGTLKFVSWSISLGSGTSGGTLAPLFTIGGGLGAMLGEAAAHAFPHLGIDPRIAALVGMAAMFAGASRALLASVVFAFETTRQPIGLLPAPGRLHRLVPPLLPDDAELHQGFPVVDGAGDLVGVVTRRDLLDPRHAGAARVRDLLSRPVAVVFEDSSLREAADHMLREGVGRLPVVARAAPRKPLGILTRSDLLAAHQRRLEETHLAEQSIDWRKLAR